MIKQSWQFDTRRSFLRTAAAASAASVIDAFASPVRRVPAAADPRFAYVGTASEGIQVLTLRRGRWIHTQAVRSRSPSAMAFHPNQNFLYAANAVDEHRGLPHGTVETYAVDQQSGALTLLGRQPLSLSAVGPRSLTVSPDGRYLVVPVYGGGAYNVLRIEANGTVGRVTGIMKEIGSGPNAEYQNSAHPHTAIFDLTGRCLLSSDFGSDRLNVFTMSAGRLVRTGQLAVHAGCGPGHVALHPSGALAYVLNELDASVSCVHLRAETGEIRGHYERVALLQTKRKITRGAVAVHPSGRTLYTLAEGMASWRIDASTGALTKIKVWGDRAASLDAPLFSPDAQNLFYLDRAQGKVMRAGLVGTRGEFSEMTEAAQVELPLSLALQFFC